MFIHVSSLMFSSNGRIAPTSYIQLKKAVINLRIEFLQVKLIYTSSGCWNDKFLMLRWTNIY